MMVYNNKKDLRHPPYGVTTGHASKAYGWRVIGEDHVKTILLKTNLTLLAIAIGVYQAADSSNVTKNDIKELEYRYDEE